MQLRSANQITNAIAQEHPMVQLQQTLGNRAVGRMLQAKLKIGQPNDQYEQEADRVAEQVTSIPGLAAGQGPAVAGGTTGGTVQRAAEKDEDKRFVGPHEKFDGPHEEDETVRRAEMKDEEGKVRRQPREEEKEKVSRQPVKEEDKKIQRQQEEEEPVQTNATAQQAPSLSPKVAANIHAMKGGGQPLPEAARATFEPRFGYDFSHVRVHTDGQAADTAKSLKARAFTVGHDIAFGSGEYAPESAAGQKSLAHELTHVVQQSSLNPAMLAEPAGSKRDRRKSGSSAAKNIAVQQVKPANQNPSIQRVLEVRPPGPGEASAFNDRQKLIDRLNTISTAIQYQLNGGKIVYKVINEGALTNFDRQMRSFIDQNAIVPMRLITSSGYIRPGPGAKYMPLTLDSWVSAYLDLDDLLASDDLTFQTNLVHFLTERFATSNYEKRIGTMTGTPKEFAEFQKAHSAGYEAESEILRDVIGDPTIKYLSSWENPNKTWVVMFGSKKEGYRIFKVFSKPGRDIEPSKMYVEMKDGRRMSIEQLKIERTKGDYPPLSGNVRIA